MLLDEISPNGVSESRLLPGLLTVLAVNKRQFPESEAMKVRADCGGRRSRLSGSTVGSSDPVQVISFTSAVTHGTTALLVHFKVCVREGTCVP